jgi:sugar lactone lactonase YvrE
MRLAIQLLAATILAIVPAILLPTTLLAQVNFNGIASTAFAPGNYQILGIAATPNGTLDYIQGVTNDGHAITQAIPNFYGQYTQSNFFNNATQDEPDAFLLEPNGQIYVLNDIVEGFALLTPTGNAPNPYNATTLTSGILALDNPANNIAVDPFGNIFFTSLNDDAFIEEVNLGGGAYRQQTLANAEVDQFVTDSAGNLYLPGSPTGGITEFVRQANGSFQQTYLFTAQLPPGGSSSPIGVAVDSAGNVLIANGPSNSTTPALYTEIPLGNGAYRQIATYSPNTLRLFDPVSDFNGNVYAVDSSTSNIVKFAFSYADFGAVAVGSSSTLALPFTVQAGTTIGSISVHTSGDFANIGGSSSCTAALYTATATCSVYINAAPQYPGPRTGAVLIADESGNPLATVRLTTVGFAPLVAFPPGTPVTFAAGSVSSPSGLATDSAGNLYVAGVACACVSVISPSGSVLEQYSGFSNPQAVAVDGIGNLYVLNNGTDILRRTPAGAIASIAKGLISEPLGLAIDRYGNIYTSDQKDNGIYEITTTGNKVFIANTGYPAQGLAVDQNFNVFASQLNQGVITETTPQGITTSVATGLHSPGALAVDAAGDLFYTSLNGNQILQLPGCCASGPAPTLVANTASSPSGLALDSAGSIYFSESAASALYRINRSTPPSLSFTPTPGGGEASNSPQTVTLQNIGNNTLNFEPVSYPTDFPADPSGSATACGNAPLNASSTCTLTIDFKPITVSGTATSIPLSETITLIDNNLDQPGGVQNISVSGTETKAPPTLTIAISSLTPVYGSGYDYNFTATAACGQNLASGTVTFYLNSVPYGPFTLTQENNSPMTTYPWGSFLAPGSKIVTAAYSGNATCAGANSNTLSFKVVAPPPTRPPGPLPTIKRTEQ